MSTLSLNVGDYSIDLVVSENNGESYIALKPLCDALGLEWRTQIKRTKSNQQFRTVVHKGGGCQDGKNREMLCLPVCEVGMWLCNINVNKVNAELKPRLFDFQRHLQVVIHDHLCSAPTRGEFQKLEKSVAFLFETVESLRFLLEEKDEQIAVLTARLEAADTLGNVLVSNAGRHLAAHKKALAAVN